MPTQTASLDGLRSLDQLRVVQKGVCSKSYKALCGQCALRRRPAKAPLRFTRSRWLWAGVPCFRSLGLPFIQECRAFLSRPREVDVVMTLLLESCDNVSNLNRIDDVHHLSIRSFGEDGNQHQHCLLPVQDIGATLKTRMEFGCGNGPVASFENGREAGWMRPDFKKRKDAPPGWEAASE